MTAHFARHRRLLREATILRELNTRRTVNGIWKEYWTKVPYRCVSAWVTQKCLERNLGGRADERNIKGPVGTLGKWRLRAIVAALCAVVMETSLLAQPIPGKVVHVRSHDLPFCESLPSSANRRSLWPRVFTFLQLQWQALRTTNALERINEDGSNPAAARSAGYASRLRSVS